MAQIKGSLTEKNLLKSFAGESQARNRYTYFAKAAEKEGYPLISQIFLKTADQERIHASRMFKFLPGGPVEITATYPAGIVGTTAENLAAAAEGENEEFSLLYPAFAETAKAEGFNDVAAMYKMISKAEAHHEAVYRSVLANLTNGTLYKKEKSVSWVCEKCGYIHEGLEAPQLCPACQHPQGYFGVYAETF